MWMRLAVILLGIVVWIQPVRGQYGYEMMAYPSGYNAPYGVSPTFQPSEFASCIFLPRRGDSGFCISFSSYRIPLRKLSFMKLNADDSITKLDIDDYPQHPFFGETVSIAGIFEPGSKLYVVETAKRKIVHRVEIPQQGTPEYIAFVRQIRTREFKSMQDLNQLFGGGQSSSSGGGTVSPSRRPCSFCNGKGWRPGLNGTIYTTPTSNSYCDECGVVPPKHSHDPCPSCCF